jgi:hypothetical protein
MGRRKSPLGRNLKISYLQNMKYLILASAITLSSLSISAQEMPFPTLSKGDYSSTENRVVVSSVNGQIYFPTEYAKLASGTPFFQDQFMKGELIDAEGKAYASNSVRINLLSNEVNFLDPASGKEMVVSAPIKWVRLTDPVKNKEYLFMMGDQIPDIKKTLAGTWFQVLVNNKVSLCYQESKSVKETIVFGQDKEASISTDDFYFINMNGSFSRVGGWKNLQELLSDKKEALDQYIHDHHLKGKSAEEYTQLVEYYNSLHK